MQYGFRKVERILLYSDRALNGFNNLLSLVLTLSYLKGNPGVLVDLALSGCLTYQIKVTH